MAWIKRNLFLVVGGVIALALMGLAIFFLITKMQQDEAVTAALNDKTETFKGLVSRPVHPGTEKVDNISAAKEEEKRLNAFTAELRKKFDKPSTNKVSDKEFRFLLDTTVSELRRDAEKSGVNLPSKDYWFTFNTQKGQVAFDAKYMDGLVSELYDVRDICKVLFDAKIHDLLGLKRAPVAKDDTAGGVDYTTEKSKTTEYGTVTPYEMTFYGFSTELAEVLEGFRRSSNCIIVKKIGMDKAPDSSASAATTPEYASPYSNPLLSSRYGLRPQVVAPAPRPQTRGLTTVLDEKKLKFTVAVEVVKLKPPGK